MGDINTLNQNSHALSNTLKLRLVLWTIRWVIGFGIIALIVKYWPSANWLWWVGGSIAAFSLLTTIAMSYFLQRKIAVIQAKAAEVERLYAEIEQQTPDSTNEA